MKIVFGIIMLGFLMACSEKPKLVESEEMEQSQAVLLVFDYLKQQAEKSDNTIKPADLKLSMEKTDHLGMTHVKFQQVYKSLPVWNKELFAHIDKQNKVYRVDQNTVLIPENFDIQAKVPTTELLPYAVKVMDKKEIWQMSQASLIIYINAKEQAILAYLVTLKAGLLEEFVVLNAENGEILHQLTGTHTQQ